jgi:hypothetical protein
MTRPNQIIAEVCEGHRITRDDLFSNKIDRKFSRARQEAYYRMRTELGLSYPRIAALMGRKDHTTVIHGIGRYYQSKFCNPNIQLTSKQARKLALHVKPFKTPLPPLDSDGEPEKQPPCLVRLNAHRKWFVLEWVADEGTVEEALEPYGLSFGQCIEFVKRYLPELSGLRQDQKIMKARELLGRKVAA